jgi:hypothetical protein
MDLLERAPVLDELGGVLAATTTGGRVVLLAGEAGLEGEHSASGVASGGLSACLVLLCIAASNATRSVNLARSPPTGR